jgi:hypothetical protein
MGPICYPETSVCNCLSTQCNISEERRSLLHYEGRLKSGEVSVVETAVFYGTVKCPVCLSQRLNGLNLGLFRMSAGFSTNTLIHFMECSPSWEANGGSSSHEIPHMVRNPGVHHRVDNSPPTPHGIFVEPHAASQFTTSIL